MVTPLPWGVRMVQTGIQCDLDAAMRQLGGDPIMLTGIMLRTDAPKKLHAMAEYAIITRNQRTDSGHASVAFGSCRDDV